MENNFNSVTKVYDTQYVNFILVVNIVSKGEKMSITVVSTFIISHSTSLPEHVKLTMTCRVLFHFANLLMNTAELLKHSRKF